MLLSISDFYKTQSRRLTVLHPTLCIRKTIVGKICSDLSCNVSRFKKKNTRWVEGGGGGNHPLPPTGKIIFPQMFSMFA